MTTCSTIMCKRRAVFRAWRPDKATPRVFCEPCFAIKVSKYDLRVERVR